MLAHKHNWGEERVTFQDGSGRLRSIPASWTDVDAPDPYIVVSAGRALFRLQDLLLLADLVQRLQSTGMKEDHP